MSDNADIATEIAQERIDRALANRPQASTQPSATECEECGDTIPSARRKAIQGTQHCAECAHILAQIDRQRKG